MKNIITGFLALILICIGGFLYYVKQDQDSIFSNKLIKDNLTVHGSGLVEDDTQTGLDLSSPFASRYYFKGKEVNNYFYHDGLCFRVVNIATNNTIKVVYAGTGTNNCSSVKNDSSKLVFDDLTNIYSESDLYNSLNSSFEENKIFTHSFPFSSLAINAKWFIGGIKMSGNKLSENIDYERGLNSEESATVSAKIGLISITDYLKSGCGKSVYDAYTTCGDDSYLYNDIPFFTISKVLWDDNNVYTVTDGMPKAMQSNSDKYYVFPSFYLKANLKVTGNGTATSPYILK